MSEFSSFAPGRVELLGNHTDYNEGVILSAAIDLGITAHGKRRDDNRITLTSDGIPEAATANLDEPLKPRGTWDDYPLGVTQMFLQAGKSIGGFEASFSSTLPLGAGLSSSAAIEVATGELLCGLFDIQIAPLDMAKLCRKAENEFVGVNCGLLDQVSSIFGRKNHVVFLDCRAESVDRIPFPDTAGLLIVNSGVKHALTGGEYNERRSQCFEAAERLGVRALRDVTSEQLAASHLPELVKRRAAHVVGENERVLKAAGFLRSGDAAAFGRLMTQSHLSSIHNFENSTPELDALVEIAVQQPGVHGARLTGGGFGGAIVALVDLQAIDTVAHAITEAYHSRTGNTGTALCCAAGDGAEVHREIR